MQTCTESTSSVTKKPKVLQVQKKVFVSVMERSREKLVYGKCKKKPLCQYHLVDKHGCTRSFGICMQCRVRVVGHNLNFGKQMKVEKYSSQNFN